MAKETREIEQSFLASLAQETGAELAEWMETLRSTGLTKNNELVRWLKNERAFNHLQATLLTGIFLNDGEPVFHYPTLFQRLFAGKEGQKALYDTIVRAIEAELPSALFIPTKTYVSLEEDCVFGCVKINKGNIRVGLDLGREPFGEYLQKGVGLGAMPNITHMVELSDVREIDERLPLAARQAYQRNHDAEATKR